MTWTLFCQIAMLIILTGLMVGAVKSTDHGKRP